MGVTVKTGNNGKPRRKCHLWDMDKILSRCFLAGPPVKKAKIYETVSFPNAANHMCSEDVDGGPDNKQLASLYTFSKQVYWRCEKPQY